jgi:hypothetical protein
MADTCSFCGKTVRLAYIDFDVTANSLADGAPVLAHYWSCEDQACVDAIMGIYADAVHGQYGPVAEAEVNILREEPG